MYVFYAYVTLINKDYYNTPLLRVIKGSMLSIHVLIHPYQFTRSVDLTAIGADNIMYSCYHCIIIYNLVIFYNVNIL